MSDLISRQAAIDAIDKYSVWVMYTQGDSQNDEAELVKNIIKQTKKAIQSMLKEDLPSAQPESTADAEFWRKRADYYSDMCSKLIADMGAGVKIEAVKIDETGITFAKNKPSAQPDRSLRFRIGEICVDESKGFISPGRAVEKIRQLLREAERQGK